MVTQAPRAEQGADPETGPGGARLPPPHGARTLAAMGIRDHIHRWLSPSLFGLIAVCFVLPFATVSCDDASTTFTGIQLVTHTVPRGGVVNEAPDCSADISVCVEHTSAPTATLAFVAALLGLALGALGIVRGPGWCAAVSFGSLLVLPMEGGAFGPDVNMRVGWVLALLLAAFAGCMHARWAWRRRRRRRAGRVPSLV